MTVEKGVVCRCDIAGIEFFFYSVKSVRRDAIRRTTQRRDVRDSIMLNVHYLYAGRAMSHRGALRQFVN